MDNINKSNIILELFNFKKGLTLEQNDVERHINAHMQLFTADDFGRQVSQKNIVRSLTERLTQFTYDSNVKSLLEKINTEIKSDELFYDLEDLYRTLESANQGMVYRHVMQTVLDIINESNARDQQIKIINELALQDWIPQVKNFMFKYTTNPRDRQNINSSGGKADAVYTIVEKVSKENEKGFLTFIGDKWFYIKESTIEVATPSDLIQDIDKLHSLNYLKRALELGEIKDDKINFQIDEDLKLSIGLDKGDLFLNEEKIDGDSSLETIFNSALIPYMRRDFYPVISETYKNLDKFVELDIVQKISNITQPFLENFVFNYKDKIYMYSVDKRSGNSFYEFDSATIVVNEVRQALGYDLSDFLKAKFSEDIKMKMDLEGREMFITSKLADINENIIKLKDCGLLEVNEQVKIAYDVLIAEKTELENDLFAVKATLSNRF